MAESEASPVASLQEEATCPVCLEYFSDPVGTECGHNFCRACISQCWDGADGRLPCPECRELCHRGSLKANRQLKNIVRITQQLALQSARSLEAGLCAKHDEKLKNTLENMRQKIVTEFEELRKFLNNQERLLLSRLEKMDSKLATAEKAKMSELSGRISSLGNLVAEIEEKCKLAAGDFMKDAKLTLNKCAKVKFQKPEEKMKYCKVGVNLDPVTAHPRLIISEARRCVEYGENTKLLPEDPRRFDFFPCVLGSEGFTTGRYYWEVEVRGGGGWYVGAARESVKRKGGTNILPSDGIWAIWGWKNEYKVLTSPLTILSPKVTLSKLGVYLDYEGRQLSLYNADTLEHLYTFRHVFTEKIYPFFWVASKVKLCLV
ncbi:E3 ubiquitin-protein ligase TRIM39-like isoform X3 [Pleurodeles waltl]|uniref:E3 ubiquitin-protein ligase TRIM39-like isoform X3 n=1 Tax=Pleurodeles waltl TaxID=8319 RepID=UPI0037098412